MKSFINFTPSVGGRGMQQSFMLGGCTQGPHQFIIITCNQFSSKIQMYWDLALGRDPLSSCKQPTNSCEQLLTLRILGGHLWEVWLVFYLFFSFSYSAKLWNNGKSYTSEKIWLFQIIWFILTVPGLKMLGILVQAQIIQTLERAIQRINHYQLDKY